MATNTVTALGQTFTRTGRTYTHAVVLLRADDTVMTVEFASTIDLARKNYDGHVKRWEAAKAGQTLRYPWSTESYRAISNIVILPVSH